MKEAMNLPDIHGVTVLNAAKIMSQEGRSRLILGIIAAIVLIVLITAVVETCASVHDTPNVAMIIIIVVCIWILIPCGKFLIYDEIQNKEIRVQAFVDKTVTWSELNEYYIYTGSDGSIANLILRDMEVDTKGE